MNNVLSVDRLQRITRRSAMTHKENYRFSLGRDDDAREVVRAGLEAFNTALIGENPYHDFALYARNGEDQVVGGMFGHSGAGWLYIDYLWLHDSQRGRGSVHTC